MPDDHFRASDDPDKVLDAILGGKNREDMGDMRRERDALPGERELTQAGNFLDEITDSAVSWWDRNISGFFSDSSDQEASSAEARIATAEDFITAIRNGDVSVDLFENAQRVNNEGIDALYHREARDGLGSDFTNAYNELLHSPHAYGLTGPMSEEGNLYMDRAENGRAYYKLTELRDEGTETPAVTDTKSLPDTGNNI